VTGLHLYNAKPPVYTFTNFYTRTRQSRSNNMEVCHGLLRTATPRCDDIVLAIVTLLRGRHSQTAYVHAIMTPYNSCLWVPFILAQHSSLSREWISQTTGRLHTVKLICIAIAEPHPYLPAMVIHANPTHAYPCVTKII